MKAYQALIEEDPNTPVANEDELNMMGYRFLWQEKHKIAKDLFEINMKLYPESFNVYDSYAEVCMEMGENDLAIKYYEKSLSLNPENRNATNQLEKIKTMNQD